jgi:hypothetical protein
MARSMAAGYYEYSPRSSTRRGWPERPGSGGLKHARGVWPDFHRGIMEASGRAVDFLPESAADAFSLRGAPAEVARQLVTALRDAPAAFDYVVLHPIPDPKWPGDAERDYTARVAREVLPPVRRALSS